MTVVCDGDGECGGSEDGDHDDGDLKWLILYCLRGFGNGQTEKRTLIIVVLLSCIFHSTRLEHVCKSSFIKFRILARNNTNYKIITMLTLFDLNQFLSQYSGFNTSNTRSLILHPLPLSFSLISPFCGYFEDEKLYARWVLNSEILHLYYSIIVLHYDNWYFIPKTKRNTQRNTEE